MEKTANKNIVNCPLKTPSVNIDTDMDTDTEIDTISDSDRE